VNWSATCYRAGQRREFGFYHAFAVLQCVARDLSATAYPCMKIATTVQQAVLHKTL